MVTFFTGLFVAFGWFCFITLGILILAWLDNRNYWMPPIYVGWGLIVFRVTLWVNLIS